MQIKNPKLLRELEECSVMETYKARDIVESLDKTEYNLRLLASGVVRGYIIDKYDKETTSCFVAEPGMVITGLNYLDSDPTKIAFQASTKSELFSIPKAALVALMGRYPEITSLYISVLTKCLIYHWESRKMLYLKTARQRYEWFLETHPGLIDVVNHASVATFLNITPVTLSRVRREMEKG